MKYMLLLVFAVLATACGTSSTQPREKLKSFIAAEVVSVAPGLEYDKDPDAMKLRVARVRMPSGSTGDAILVSQGSVQVGDKVNLYHLDLTNPINSGSVVTGSEHMYLAAAQQR